jgi:endonuclease/exonuclease/phosphatase family metal-dependent hydrolase
VGTSATVRIATFNIYRRLVDRRRLEDLRDLLATPDLDVAGLQEIAWELDGNLPEGWDFWQPDDPAAQKDPLVWRRDLWGRLDSGSRLVGERVEDGRGTAPARYVNWVVLRHLPTDQVVAVANIHPNAGVEEDGRPRPLPRTREHTDTVTGAIAVLDEVSNTWRCPSILVGDLNVDYGDDKSVRDPRFPYALLTSAGFTCVWELGEQSTRSDLPVIGRTIDHVWARGTADVDVVFTAVRTPTHWGSWAKGDVESDHLPVIADVDLRPALAIPQAVVTRDAWGSTGQRPTPATHPIGATRGITVHRVDAADGPFEHALCARKVRALERFDEVNRGLAGIAYNALVCPHGSVFEGRGPGVRSAANGHGSPDDDWYAVCYLGEVGEALTEQGEQGLLDAFAWLTAEGDAGPERNGHRDHRPTTCPGEDIYAWVHSLDQAPQAGEPVGPPRTP